MGSHPIWHRYSSFLGIYIHAQHARFVWAEHEMARTNHTHWRELANYRMGATFFRCVQTYHQQKPLIVYKFCVI